MKTEPEFRTRTEFKVVGVERYTSAGIPSIRDAWAEFGKRSGEIKHAVAEVAFGIEDYSREFDMNPGGFPNYHYIAGLEVKKLEDIPEGMTGKTIAKAEYAVFIYNGPIASLHEFFGYIYGEWLPKSGYSMDPKLSLDFERYPEPVMDMNSAQIEIWVPIVS